MRQDEVGFPGLLEELVLKSVAKIAADKEAVGISKEKLLFIL